MFVMLAYVVDISAPLYVWVRYPVHTAIGEMQCKICNLLLQDQAFLEHKTSCSLGDHNIHTIVEINPFCDMAIVVSNSVT